MNYVSLGYRSSHVHASHWARIPDDGGLKYVADHRPRLHTGGTGLQEVYEVVDLGDDRVAFKVVVAGRDVPLNSFLTVDPDAGSDTLNGGAVRFAELPAPGERETFLQIWLPDDRIALRTCLGTYVTAEHDGDGSPLVVDRSELGDWQKFWYLVPPPELLPDEPTPEPQRVSVEEQARGSVEDARRQGGVVEGLEGLRGKLFRSPGG